MSPELRTALIAFLLFTSTLFVVAAGSFPGRNPSIDIVFRLPPRSILVGPDLVSRLFTPLGLPWGDSFTTLRPIG